MDGKLLQAQMTSDLSTNQRMQRTSTIDIKEDANSCAPQPRDSVHQHLRSGTLMVLDRWVGHLGQVNRMSLDATGQNTVIRVTSFADRLSQFSSFGWCWASRRLWTNKANATYSAEALHNTTVARLQKVDFVLNGDT